MARMTASGTFAVFSSVNAVGLVSKLVADDFIFATTTSADRPDLIISSTSLFVRALETGCGLAAAPAGSCWEGKATTARLRVSMRIAHTDFFMGVSPLRLIR